MKTKNFFASSFCALAAATCLAGSAHAAIVIGGQAYNVSTPTESMSASFLSAAGGVSTNFYGGLVQLTVSGSGASLASRLNDAFYVYTGGPVFADGSFYQLTTDNAPLIGLNPAQDAKNFIVYDVDSDTEITARPYVPTYRAADHTYTFVVDLGLLGVAGTSRLHFGVSDGQYGDNSGAYDITISQLTVPEPGSLLLVATSGLALLAASRRRRPLQA